MAEKQPVPDLLLVVIAFIIALLGAVSVQGVTGTYGPVSIFLIILFLILWLAASQREWTLPFSTRFIRSRKMSEIFLGLFLFTASIVLSWSLAIVISRASSDIEGILAGLVIFGFLEMIIAGSRDWQ